MNKVMVKVTSLSLAAAVIAGGAFMQPAFAATKSAAAKTSRTAVTQKAKVSTYAAKKAKLMKLSKVKKAEALVNTFATGDTQTAKALLASGYIQHNLSYKTGEKAFLQSVKQLSQAKTKTTVKTVRAFQDGNKVVLQSVYNFAGSGEQVAFDIFRFNKKGEIAEHWDNLAAKAKPNLSGHTQIDGVRKATELKKTESNRKLVKNFLNDVMMGKNLKKTPDYFNGDSYIQHNTTMADGVSGLNAALKQLAEQGIEMKYNKVHQVLACGNLVLAVSEGTFGGKATSYYDLWRVENGKIAEHWDVMQTIPEKSSWQNQNGKF